MKEYMSVMTMRDEIHEIGQKNGWGVVMSPKVDMWYQLDKRITPNVIAVVWDEHGEPVKTWLDNRLDDDDHGPHGYLYHMAWTMDLRMARDWIDGPG